MPDAPQVIFGQVSAKKVDRLAQLKAKLSQNKADSWGKLGRIYRNVHDAISESELNENRRILARAQELIADALKQKRFSGRAEFITEMRKLLGFPETHDFGFKFDPTEISTDRRLRLIYDTQFARAKAQIQRQDDIAQGTFELFPALELKRRGSRKHPRNWKRRWTDAGGKLYGGRMIALVDDPIWAKISRWGNPLPPFDYNSGMGLAKISLAEALRMNIIKQNKTAKTTDKAKDDFEELKRLYGNV
jgi:hypothetical protein